MSEEHEIRDPIHGSVRFNDEERIVVDSVIVQRLKQIHQLALTYLLYPGANHSRFEHSLGVMELAGRVYDALLRDENITHDCVREILPARSKQSYWRLVIRMAALCHDVGHIPFSHSAEQQILPQGWTHERLTFELINSKEMSGVWEEINVRADDVAKLAVGQDRYYQYSNKKLSPWESILSEVIVGDTLGVDRMDYLLRDSYHAGVPYARIDPYRLMGCLRILPKFEGSDEPVLGVEEAGIRDAEALLLARYSMFSQLYFHHVRRIYDIHLIDYLKSFFQNLKVYPTTFTGHLSLTDNEILVALRRAAFDSNASGHDAAKRIMTHNHFRRVYQRNPNDQGISPEAGKAVYSALSERFGRVYVRRDSYIQKRQGKTFPVRTADGRIALSINVSQTLEQIPITVVDCVYVAPEKRDEATKLLKENLSGIVKDIS